MTMFALSNTLINKLDNLIMQIHMKKRNRLTCERVEQLVYVRFNNLHTKRKSKAKKNNNIGPLVTTEATCA